jgi:hypothetical protein
MHSGLCFINFAGEGNSNQTQRTQNMLEQICFGG